MREESLKGLRLLSWGGEGACCLYSNMGGDKKGRQEWVPVSGTREPPQSSYPDILACQAVGGLQLCFLVSF